MSHVQHASYDYYMIESEKRFSRESEPCLIQVNQSCTQQYIEDATSSNTAAPNLHKENNLWNYIKADIKQVKQNIQKP